jgi:RNA polymerase sigma-70 factor (ECF subfamily)
MDFEALYDAYARRLLGWAARRTQGPAEAEDLIQDTFLAIHVSLHGYRGESDVDAWVFGVARNIWRVQARARARLKRSAPHVPLDDVAPYELVDERTPEAELEIGRALAQVEAEGRAQLGPPEWARLVDYSLERTDLDELMAETGLSRDALKSRISRARRRIFEACTELAPS